MDILKSYFPELNPQQLQQLNELNELYATWNARINVISRKDMDNFTIHHVLHSLAIAKVHPFQPGDKVLDIGTGGGFPGIPLAIAFPETHFTLTDSIAKKIQVVEAVAQALGLKNVTTKVARAETLTTPFDYVVTRAVAQMSELLRWSKNKHPKKIIALKGGDLKEELQDIKKNIRVVDIKDLFSEPFFETKKVVICS
ncbi:MAG TPA: 16S rRNA (guanine(527)-N(7))-methyltransferase RsmG [Chitinophagales bacterium]|nr:16S rRNA (guanine(527)-N(7))-methyltransferase RsmG [Chitinophagales bacterium]